jgi:Ca2+-binding RTX toxin-like protein
VIAAIGGAALVGAVSAFALTISGTNGPDVLRGTGGPDTIRGKGGNDQLFGLGGNDFIDGGAGTDVMNGGPGNDRLRGRDGSRDTFRCGAGRDTATADAQDRVGGDCESVLRPSSPQPQPPPPPPPPPSPPPAQDGHYLGATSQNERITFDVVGGGRTLTNFAITGVNQSCVPDRYYLYGAFSLGSATISIAGDGTISGSSTFPGTVGPYAATYTITLTARFNSSISAGTFREDVAFSDAAGLLRCTSGPVTWNATRA